MAEAQGEADPQHAPDQQGAQQNRAPSPTFSNWPPHFNPSATTVIESLQDDNTWFPDDEAFPIALEALIMYFKDMYSTR